MASMKDLDRMLKRGGKTTRKMPLKAGSWLANATRSVGYSSLDMLKQLMPNTIELGQSAAESAGEIREALSGMGSQSGKLKNVFDASVYMKLGKEGLKNALEDLKSGDLYNERRYQEYIDKSMDVGDEDFDFGDDFDLDEDEDFDVDLTSDDDGASVNVSRSHKGRNEATRITLVNNIGPDSPLVQATEFQTKVAVKGVGVIVDANTANTQATLTMMSRIGNDQLKMSNAIHQTVIDLSQSLQTQLSQYSTIAEKYFNDSIELQTRIADTLDKVRENTAVGAGAMAAKDPKDVPDMLDMFSGGFINITEYKRYVRKNLNNWIDSNLVASQIKSVMSDTDTLGSMMAAPLRFVTEGIAKQMIPAAVQTAMEQLDRTVGEFVITKLTQLGAGANSDNPILSTLGQIFGLRTKLETRVDKSKYEKGAVPFDGITHRTINDVIPTYLRQIASALTGKEEMVFDYDKGTYRTLSSVQRDHESDTRRTMLSEFQDDLDEFRESIKKTFVGATNEQMEAINKNFEQMLIQMVRNGGLSNYRTRTTRSGDVIDPLRDLYEQAGVMNPQDMARYTRAWMESRYHAGEGYKNMEMIGRKNQNSARNMSMLTAERQANPIRYNDIYIDNGLGDVNNALMNISKNGRGRTRVSQSAGPLADEYGKKPAYYLRNIWKTLLGGIDVRIIGNVSGGPFSGLGGPTGQLKELLDEESNYDTAIAKENADTVISGEKRQKMLNEGRLDLEGESSDEQIQASMDRIANERVNQERAQKRKRSILETVAGAGGTAGKWAQSINNRIEQGSGVLQTTFQTANNVLYRLVFGDENGKRGLGAAFDLVIGGIKGGFKKLGTFIDTKVLKPIDDALFGKEGLFTKMKETEFYKNITGKVKGGFNKVRDAVFGKKVKGPDGKEHYEGGLISSTMNELKNVGKSVSEAIFGKRGPDGKSLPLDQDHSILGNIKRAGKSLGDAVKDYIGVERDSKGKTKSFGTIMSEGLDSIWKHTKSRFSDWTDQLLGPASKGDTVENARDLFDNFRTEMKGKGGKIGAGAVIGAIGTPIISSQLGILGSMFLPGGPIGGAILGAGISFVSQSETLKTKLFGEKDETTGERTGGLITKEFQDFFKNNKTGMGIGAFAGLAANFGLIPSLFVPGGPIGGAIIGTGLSMAKRAGVFDQILYGPGGTKEDPTGGIVKKFKDAFGKDKNFKNVALDAGMGAGLGIIGSFFLPGGPIAGAVLGAATNIAINTDRFKTMLFGEEEVDEQGNKTGKRSGGLFGRFQNYISEQIFTPLAKKVEETQARFMYFMEDKVFRPIATAMAPITNKFTEFGEGIMSGFKAVFKSIANQFHQTVTKPVGDAIDKWLIQPLKKVANTIFNAFTKVLGAIVSAPFAAIGALGQGIFAHDKRRGANAASREEFSKVGSIARDAYNARGGGFAGLLSGALAGGRQAFHAFSSDVREAGAFSEKGAGRYATRENNPEILNKKLKEDAKNKYLARMAEINEKYGDPTKARSEKRLKKAKPGTTAAIQAEIIDQSKVAKASLDTQNKIKEDISTIAESVKAIKDRILGFGKGKGAGSTEESAGVAEGGIRGALRRMAVQNAPEIRKRLRGVTRFGVYTPDSEVTTGGASTVETSTGKTRIARNAPKVKASTSSGGATKIASTPPNAESISYDESATVAGGRSRDRDAKKVERRTKGIASDVSDIADSVHGQLNGLGKNVFKIYRLLLRKLGGDDADYDGENNKEYMGLGGRLRTMFNRPLKALQSLIFAPINMLRDAVTGVVDTVVNIGTTIKNAAFTIGKGLFKVGELIFKAGLSLLEIPINISRIAVEAAKMVGPIIKEGFVQAIGIAGKALQGAVGLVVKGVEGVANVLVNAASGLGTLIGGIVGGLGQLLGGIGLLGKGALSGIGKLFAGGGKLVGGILGGVAGGVIGGIGGAVGKVSKFVGGIKDKFSKVYRVYVVGGKLDEVVKLTTIGDSITKKMAELADNVAGRFEKAIGSLSNRLGPASGIEGDVDGIGDVISDATIGGAAIGGLSSKIRVSRGPKIASARANKDRAASVARGSAEAIRNRFAKEDKETAIANGLAKINESIRAGNEENKEHHSIWESMFGKKGLLVMAILAGIAFITSEKFRNLIFGALSAAVDLLIDKLPGVISSIIGGFVGSDRKDNKNGFQTNADGNIILDENGQPIPLEAPENKSLLDVFAPKATRIDPNTGKAITYNEWSDKSGTAVNFVRGRIVSPIKKAIRIGKGIKAGVTGAARGVKTTISKGSKLVDNAVNSKLGQTVISKFKGTAVGKATTAAATTVKGAAASAKSTMAGAANAVINKKDDILVKFKGLVDDAIKLMKDKFSGFLAKHGGKLGGTLLKFLDDIPKKLTSTVLGKFVKKITSAVSKVAASAGSLLLSDVAWGIAGAINTNPAQVFKVDSKDVDWKMQAIGRVIEGLLATSVGSIIDVVCEIVSAISGFDAVQWICIQLYNLISSKKDEENLRKAQDEFKKSYEEYNQKEYEAYVKNCQDEGIEAMSYEEYMDSGLGRSFDQYNQEQNKTLVQTVVNGASKAVAGVKSLGAKAVGAVKDAGTAIANTSIGKSVTKAVDTIGKNVSSFFSGITSSLGFGKKETAEDTTTVASSGGNGGFGARGRRVRGGFGSTNIEIPSTVADIPSGIKTVDEYTKLMYIAFRALTTPFLLIDELMPRSSFRSIIDMINAGSGTLFSSISGLLGSTETSGTISKIATGVKKTASGLFGKIKSVGSNVLNWLTGENKKEGTSGGRGGFGGGVPYFSQNDPSIAMQPYNLSNGQSDTMGNRGCGPTAMAMAMGGLGKAVSPLSMAQDATAGGYSTEVGTTPDFFGDEAAKLGVSSAQSPATATNITGGLSSGNPIIIQGASSGGNSPFTSKGHYVVGTGVSGSKIAINDPRGPEFSGLYDISDVTKDATNMWSFGGYGAGRPRGYIIPVTGGFGGVTPESVIKIAMNEVGYMEKGSNSQLDDKTANVGQNNYTKYGILTGTNGQAWCAAFVCWCFNQACGGDRNKLKTVICGNMSAGCDQLMANFKKAGRFDKNPAIGDIIMFGVPGDASHTGIVAGVNGSTITTIEGNTSGGTGLEREGNGVCVKTYATNHERILGYCHPVYEGTTAFTGINGTTVAASSTSTGTTGTTGSSYSSYSSTTENKPKSFTEMLSGFASAIVNPIMEKLGFSTENDDTSATGSNPSEVGDGNIQSSTIVTPDLTGDYIGKHVKQFESGTTGSATISSGKGDYGGVSFGSYQFPSYGKSEVGKDSNLYKFWSTYYGAKYPNVKPGNNQAFKDAWMKEAKSDPQGFYENEYAYMFPNYYGNARDIFSKNGLGNFDDYDRAAQEALWSTTVQLGAGGPSTSKGAFALFKKAGVNTNMEPTEFINKLYDTKISNVPTNFKSSSAAVQNSIKNRYARERNIVLGLVDKPKVDTSKYSVKTAGGSGGFGGGARPKAWTTRYGRTFHSGGYGPEDDTTARVIALLETIAEATTGTRTAVETLSAKDVKSAGTSSNTTNNVTYNTVNADASTKSRKLVPGKDRTGYTLAKQLAKGTFAYG